MGKDFFDANEFIRWVRVGAGMNGWVWGQYDIRGKATLFTSVRSVFLSFCLSFFFFSRFLYFFSHSRTLQKLSFVWSTATG
jgi:hypothetical protein